MAITPNLVSKPLVQKMGASQSNIGPAFHIAIGGLVCAAIALPLINNPVDPYANPNPLGYLLVLLGFPLGGLVYRIRSRKWQIDPIAKRWNSIAMTTTLLLPLTLWIICGHHSKAIGMIAIGSLVSVSTVLAILLCGARRPPKSP
jgi:hypothetical protein